jgi:rapamycin-insensitive companion of mTOR
MLLRALHLISTQRYRLPVRRYIIDLFNLELTPELVTTLKECLESLKAHPPFQPSKSDASRLSIFGRIGRTRRSSESDDEDDELDAAATPTMLPSDQPVITLQPVTKIVGFDISST